MKLQIAEVRRKRKMSQGDLAREVGATQSMIGKLERGEREMTFGWLQRIAEVLGVPTGDLFDATDDAVRIGYLDSDGRLVEDNYEPWTDSADFPEGATKFKINSISKDAALAFQVLSELPLRLPAHSELVFEKPGKRPKPEHLDRLAVIWITEAEPSITQAYKPYVGYLMPGTKPGHYHIIRLSGPPMQDAMVHFVSLITDIKLP